MRVLVDSSAWIDYFRGTGKAGAVDRLIEEDLVVTNDLILAELIPALNIRRQTHIVALLREVRRQPMTVNWDEIVLMQTSFLRAGINGVGIPDIMIVQNAVQGGLHLFSNDKHFALISKHTKLEIYG